MNKICINTALNREANSFFERVIFLPQNHLSWESMAVREKRGNMKKES